MHYKLDFTNKYQKADSPLYEKQLKALKLLNIHQILYLNKFK